MSAGVEGITTVSPGMWASSASRLCECWLPDERPAPNWVRTVSAISAPPPVMNGSLAAWLSSWSKQTPRKSRYISSTTGRMPAMAAPTPSPMIAVSEIGVSRTRSPNRSRRPRVSPKTLPPSPTSMPATNTRSSVCQLGLERIVDGVHRAEHRVRRPAAAGGSGPLRSRPQDELGDGGRLRGCPAAGPPPRRGRDSSATDDSSAFSSSSPTPASRSRASWTSSGSRAFHSWTSSAVR